MVDPKLPEPAGPSRKLAEPRPSPGAERLDACTAADRIRRGELTSVELVGACLARIEEREHDVGAWQFLAREQALVQAREADLGPSRGRLHGVPIAVKDLIDTCDMPTALGSSIYARRQPEWDAACVAATRAAGVIVIGKTVTTEFASFHPGKTRNPHDRSRTPGGSSSGSAAAVADFMVPLAFGTQTAASITRPAAFCGVVGYKGTFGELPLAGVRPLSHSLDTLGLFAREVADVALLRDVLLGLPASTSPEAAAAPRFGVCRTASWRCAEPATRDALGRAIAALRVAGAAVGEITLPASYAALNDAQQTIMNRETARNYAFEMTRHTDALSPVFRAICAAGAKIDHASYVAALRCCDDARARLPGVFGNCDALVTPATPGEAPPIESGTGDPVMSRMWTALGVPTLALPVPRPPGALPIAIQLIGRLHQDAALLEAGTWAARALARIRV